MNFWEELNWYTLEDMFIASDCHMKKFMLGWLVSLLKTWSSKEFEEKLSEIFSRTV